MPLRDQLQAALGNAYSIERELGGGGMSSVFVATDTRLRRSVVVKVMSAELAAGLNAERFEREIRLAASLQQANIVPVLSAGEMEGLPYYTMPFVEGESLRARIAARGRVSIIEAVSILRDVARALSYAHEHGVVHRDIKPDNVLLSHGTAVVTDFGIAKALSASRAQGTEATLTQIGTSIGTAAYMSPEQAAGDPELDHRADIYAFGCMAYELLAGQPPFSGTSPQRVLAAHLTETPRAVDDLRPDTPGPLASLVMRCLAKNMGDRPPSASMIVQSLDSIVTPSGGHSATTLSRLRNRKPRLVHGIGSAVVAALLLIGAMWRGRAASDGRDDRSIAVLPLENLSGDRSNDYFGEGLAEEMTNALGKAGLRVIGRSSARALVGRGLNAQAIGRELHAGTVLQGSVQRSSDRLRINVSLVSTSDGSVVWSEKYDREIRDVFAVQDEIARSVAGQLRVTLAGGSAATLVRRETDDPEAHALYLQGLFAWNRRTAPMVRKAIELFEQAARRDPNYARPHAGIAMAYIVLPVYDDVPNRETISKALDAARRALSLDSLLPEAHATIGLANAYYYNNSEAERSFAKALALDSSFATAHFWRAILLGQVGRLEDAIRETQRAFELEPTSLVMQTNVASALANARRYAAADSVYRSILALDPTFHLGMLFRARSLIDQRQLGEAIALLEALAAQPNLRKSEKLGLLAYAYAMAGQKAQARAALARLPDDTLLSVSGAVAAALDALGDRDAAVAMFKRAVAQHDQWITIVGRGAHFDALRKDLRLTAVFARIESP